MPCNGNKKKHQNNEFSSEHCAICLWMLNICPGPTRCNSAPVCPQIQKLTGAMSNESVLLAQEPGISCLFPSNTLCRHTPTRLSLPPIPLSGIQSNSSAGSHARPSFSLAGL